MFALKIYHAFRLIFTYIYLYNTTYIHGKRERENFFIPVYMCIMRFIFSILCNLHSQYCIIMFNINLINLIVSFVSVINQINQIVALPPSLIIYSHIFTEDLIYMTFNLFRSSLIHYHIVISSDVIISTLK